MRCCWLVVLAACKFSAGTGSGAGDGSVDVMPLVDAAPPDTMDPNCFGSGAFYICVQAVPTGSVRLMGAYSTTACVAPGAPAMIGNTPVCAIVGGALNLQGGDVFGIGGDKPLVLIAVDDIFINGVLDVSSGVGDTGPDANAAECNSTGIAGVGNVTGGGGGSGGSFGSKGGNGGTGGGGAGGVATAAVIAPVAILRGGCPGGLGGPGTVVTPAEVGPGGGAVYLVARDKIEVNGIINASGAGGSATLQGKNGGYGGGSGGMIVFHAGMLDVRTGAKILANGGGGGAGSGNSSGGAAGSDPNPTDPVTTPAPGGPSATSGAQPGGDGAAGPTAAMPGSPNTGGGGGAGGGGHGVIRVLKGGTIPAAVVSPPPTT